MILCLLFAKNVQSNGGNSDRTDVYIKLSLSLFNDQRYKAWSGIR